MKKHRINECIQLTKQLLGLYYHGDVHSLYQYLHEDCLWIGAREDEFYHGKNEIQKILDRDIVNLPDINLSQQQYLCVTNDTHSCAIAGSYIGMTNPNTKEMLREMQRVTFTWKEENGQLFIMHMHVSNPLHIIEKDESFPHMIGKRTKLYLDMLIARDIEHSGAINVKDKRNIHHVIRVSSITYCEAIDRNCILHTDEGDIFARILLLDLERLLREKNSDMFMRIHKSYVINKFDAVSIQRYEVQMRGDYTIPVSQNRYKEVLEWLMG